MGEKNWCGSGGTQIGIYALRAAAHLDRRQRIVLRLGQRQNPFEKREKNNITLAEKPFQMTTANGKVEVSYEAVIPIEATGSETSACVMDNASCVLSL